MKNVSRIAVTVIGLVTLSLTSLVSPVKADSMEVTVFKSNDNYFVRAYKPDLYYGVQALTFKGSQFSIDNMTRFLCPSDPYSTCVSVIKSPLGVWDKFAIITDGNVNYTIQGSIGLENCTVTHPNLGYTMNGVCKTARSIK